MRGGSAGGESLEIDIQKLGGSQKIGRVILEVDSTEWRHVAGALVKHYAKVWSTSAGCQAAVRYRVLGFGLSDVLRAKEQEIRITERKHAV